MSLTLHPALRPGANLRPSGQEASQAPAQGTLQHAQDAPGSMQTLNPFRLCVFWCCAVLAAALLVTAAPAKAALPTPAQVALWEQAVGRFVTVSVAVGDMCHDVAPLEQPCATLREGLKIGSRGITTIERVRRLQPERLNLDRDIAGLTNLTAALQQLLATEV